MVNLVLLVSLALPSFQAYTKPNPLNSLGLYEPSQVSKDLYRRCHRLGYYNIGAEPCFDSEIGADTLCRFP